MSVLISKKLFPIDIKYVDIKNKMGVEFPLVIEGSSELEKKYGDRVKTIHTQWQTPTWKEGHEAARSATVIDSQTGDRRTDLNTYSGIVLERFLKQWDLTDETGKPIPVIPENVALLDSGIAMALAAAFINRTIPSEEDLGN